MLYLDRIDAGHQLAQKLAHYGDRDDVIVLALPRGGVPVGYAVAQALRAPLDVFLVRKIGVPGQEELAMGAVASGGVRVLNEDVLRELDISPEELDRVSRAEMAELERRDSLYRNGRPVPDVSGKIVIIVDDGLATGSSMRAAAQAVRQQGPAKIVIAVPVAAQATCSALAREGHEVVCNAAPDPFYAVGQWYRDFSQITDDEVRDLLARAAEPPGARAPEEAVVRIGIEGEELEGDLTVPPGASGLVIFAHGSGSSRHSRRNRFVAAELNRGGVATLLIDLLTAREEQLDARTGHLRFDIELLASRLLAATAWAARDERVSELAIGYFGASTGGAAALVAAARVDAGHSPANADKVAAIVSRGGRPDLAGSALPQVKAPTLLIVGGEDREVLELNRHAFAELRCEKKLEVVPGATHLFEEPGALEQVATLARDWFAQHFTRGSQDQRAV
jgi:putative phosphoribosyl transferase